MFVQALVVTFSLQVAEPPPSTAHSGKLSVLRKRWEALQPSSCRTRSASSSCGPAQPLTHIAPAARLRPVQDQDLNVQVAPEKSPGPAWSSQPQNRADMEATPPRGSVGGAEVPDMEKPSVPLSSLKMMFETGENLGNKASPPQRLMAVSQVTRATVRRQKHHESHCYSKKSACSPRSDPCRAVTL